MDIHPEGYARFEWDGWQILVREEDRSALDDPQRADPERLAGTGEDCFRGRGRPVRVAWTGGRSGVLRRYLHGGLLRGLTGSRFLGFPRPLAELVATERARRAGVRVPVVLAAWHRRRFPVGHEGWILTEEIPGARDLRALLADGEPAGPLLRRAGRETRKLHEAGVRHADLHVKNVLAAAGVVYLIDFDRARVSGPVPERDRVGNLLRFDRSVVKLERSGIRVPVKDRLRFFHGYAGGPVARELRAEVVSRCRRNLARHRRWWSLLGS